MKQKMKLNIIKSEWVTIIRFGKSSQVTINRELNLITVYRNGEVKYTEKINKKVGED